MAQLPPLSLHPQACGLDDSDGEEALPVAVAGTSTAVPPAQPRSVPAQLPMDMGELIQVCELRDEEQAWLSVLILGAPVTNHCCVSVAPRSIVSTRQPQIAILSTGQATATPEEVHAMLMCWFLTGLADQRKEQQQQQGASASHDSNSTAAGAVCVLLWPSLACLVYPLARSYSPILSLSLSLSFSFKQLKPHFTIKQACTNGVAGLWWRV